MVSHGFSNARQVSLSKEIISVFCTSVGCYGTSPSQKKEREINMKNLHYYIVHTRAVVAPPKAESEETNMHIRN